MVRPCFLVVDREFSSGISSRKLLIETAKFNVITAYNGAEGLETLAAFPAVNVAVVDEHIEDIPCTELVQELKRRKPDLIVIVVGDQIRCKDADYYVEPFRPDKLLERLQKLFPAATDAIAKTNEALSSLEKDR
jgi:DNA-binding response OmpR family regulator